MQTAGDRVKKILKYPVFIAALALVIVLTAGFGVYSAIHKSDIVSWCIADVNNDGKDEILAIAGVGVLPDTHERYGQQLLICDLSALDAIKSGDSKRGFKAAHAAVLIRPP